MKLIRIITILTCVAVLSACGSSVKLKEKPKLKNEDYISVSSNESLIGDSTIDVDQQDMKKLIDASFVFYFDFDDYSVKPVYQQDLAKHAGFLKNNPNYGIILEGHTDQIGGSEYNLALGQKRAQAVQNNLGILGVLPIKMESISYGKERPVVYGSTRDELAQNRRVEVRYVKAK